MSQDSRKELGQAALYEGRWDSPLATKLRLGSRWGHKAEQEFSGSEVSECDASGNVLRNPDGTAVMSR